MKSTQLIRLSTISSSDRRMDILDTHAILDTPINKYEISCNTCTFPNIDKTPDPYFIAKGRDFSGVEIMEADLGNLFVSNRVKQIFEILFPNQCTYKKTFIHLSDISTKWWLAIPNNTIISGKVKDDIPRCKTCNQPLHAHPGTQYEFWDHELEASFDILKSENWYSTDEDDWKRCWIGRDCFLSVRLISLLKRINAKGIYKTTMREFPKYKQLTKAEKLWVEGSIETIGALKTNIAPEITQEDIEKFKLLYTIADAPDLNIGFFERKFKVNANEITRMLCAIKSGTKINLGLHDPFVIEEIENWEQTRTKIKLIAFAFDGYGNSLLFNPADKKCPVYILDHETMIYDLLHSSVIYLTNV